MHGFRASAKTILKNYFDLDQDLIEVQLGHTVDKALGTSYDRAEMVLKRQLLIDEWANIVDWLVDGKQISEYKPRNVQVIKAVDLAGLRAQVERGSL
ncbi:MAG: hypothetical protein Q4F13_11540 [Pseudomonadota bacterium]|nr:hypothetical protein [Pseudomonadota bacterium]